MGLKEEQTRRKEKEQKEAKAFRDILHDVTKIAAHLVSEFQRTRNIMTKNSFNRPFSEINVVT